MHSLCPGPGERAQPMHYGSDESETVAYRDELQLKSWEKNLGQSELDAYSSLATPRSSNSKSRFSPLAASFCGPMSTSFLLSFDDVLALESVLRFRFCRFSRTNTTRLMILAQCQSSSDAGLDRLPLEVQPLW